MCYMSYMIRTQSPDMQSLTLMQEACALFYSTLLTYVWHKIKIHRNVFKHSFVGPVNYLGSWTTRHAPCSRRMSVSMKH